MSSKTPAEVPTSPDTWLFLVRRLRTWVIPEDEPPSRPYLIAAINLNTGAFHGHDLGLWPALQEA